MKITRMETLINVGNTEDLIKNQINQIKTGLHSVVNPSGAKTFSLYNGNLPNGEIQKHPNGVKPIKSACINYLVENGWTAEFRMDLGVSKRTPGPIDAVSCQDNSAVALEWETGNISSSHRSLNRMTIGLLQGKILGGILVLPSGITYPYLTDRVGNFPELEPYFDVWRKANYNLERGYLGVIEFEHDSLSNDPSLRIHKGTDGRALR